MTQLGTQRISIEEFQKLGFLQEVNRKFFHPLGLALEVVLDDDGKPTALGGIWDYREDPEGIIYDYGTLAEPEAKAKADRVSAEFEKHRVAREKLLGDAIQPLPLPKNALVE